MMLLERKRNTSARWLRLELNCSSSDEYVWPGPNKSTLIEFTHIPKCGGSTWGQLLVRHTLDLTWLRYKNDWLQRWCEVWLSAMLMVLSVVAMVFVGIAYSARCDSDKRYGSLIVALHFVRGWTLLREVLRFVLEYQTFKKVK